MKGRRDIDGGWAWMVLVGAFCSHLLNGGLCYSMGILTEALLELFHDDLTLTSAVGSVVVGAQCCIGPVSGLLCKKIGCRACTIIGGVVAAVGFTAASFSDSIIGILACGAVTGAGYGLPLVACNVMLAQYFHRLRPVAAGIGMTGSGVGIFAGSPFIRLLIDSYGLRGTFLILAGISAHLCVIGCLLRPLPKARDEEIIFKSYTNNIGRIKPKPRDCSSCFTGCGKCSVLRNRGFLLYLASLCLWALAESAAVVHFPNYCTQQGTSKMATALLYTVMGIGCTVSRLFTGFAASDANIDNITLHAGQVGVAGIFTGLFPLYSRTYGGQAVFAGAIGVYTSGVNSLLCPINVQLLGLEDFPTGYGLGELAQGVGYLLGSPIAGKIVDSGATYTESYIFSGCTYVLSSLLALMIPLVHSTAEDSILPAHASVLDLHVHLDTPDTEMVFTDQKYPLRGSEENVFTDQKYPLRGSEENEEQLELLQRITTPADISLYDASTGRLKNNVADASSDPCNTVDDASSSHCN